MKLFLSLCFWVVSIFDYFKNMASLLSVWYKICLKDCHCVIFSPLTRLTNPFRRWHNVDVKFDRFVAYWVALFRLSGCVGINCRVFSDWRSLKRLVRKRLEPKRSSKQMYVSKDLKRTAINSALVLGVPA
jgi:hypothetical protein